ncbi:MAG: hypothetical protein LC790_17480 [Actinobacteria bacterium]|nr:hypothetical protein [Actinomycetota bacterium]
MLAVKNGPALLQRLSGGADTRAVLDAPWVPWLVVALAIVTAVVAAVRFVVTRKTLSSRVCLCVLPTETFDPSDQALRFFSRQLPGVPRLVRGWMDPRAGAVRVMMGSAGQGRMMYSWSAPERSRSALQAAAGAYDEIELRPLDTIDTATVGAVALSSAGGGDGDDDAPAPRQRDRGDSADELDLDEAEALGELVELSPFWSGDLRDSGPEEP